ncbi:DUF5777 family beta-barrel protein [Terrimonas pollutisoli]|uniref:DUF5777 family beta-barrel protein n=1 Tax=Terrimonas pollutisoli TaxID=3034147 RepID=UPI0023EB4302|nr:DUF5777 family beta-barrel protein [Terrimonas sp. H1YJ31]
MRNLLLGVFMLAGIEAISQDTTIIEPPKQPETDYIWIFSSPRLINANTVELQPKGILEFKVTHNFGDVAGDNGGIKNFFGLDNATDVRIGFQYGLSKRINLIAARAKGAGSVQQLYELGFKYRLLQQANDSKHPLSLTLFANTVVSSMKASTVANQENSFDDFSDRLSETVQLLIARKFGNISLQLSPTLVNRNYVPSEDDNALFALGGAFRLPVRGRFSLLFDYFHTFRSQSSIDYFKTQGVKFYDAMGVGVELLTEGHVFHLNFTNATEILENRFIPGTVTSWGDGEFRWGFTVSRDFDLFWKKKNRK